MERFIKHMCSVMLTIIILSVTFTNVFAQDERSTAQILSQDLFKETESMSLIYQSSYTDIGWDEPVGTNEISGSTATDRGLDAFALSIPENLGNVQYRVHVSNVGWEDWVANAERAGDENSGNSIQAIQIEFTDEAQENYDIYYHVNVENLGWLDWAKNGEVAGTVGLSESVKAIQVTYTEKGGEAPGKTEVASLSSTDLANIADLKYSAHVSQQGWQETVGVGQIAGTTGYGLAIEALKVELPEALNFDGNSKVNYSVHVQNIGWTATVENGQEAGTTGQSLSIEAVALNLTGKAAGLYDIYYRVHSSFYGWLDWAKNGAQAGTIGISTPVEAIEIRLVPKNNYAPGSTVRSLITPEYLREVGQVNYNTFVQNVGWQQGFSNGQDAGTTGMGLQLESFTVNMPNRTPNSSVIYQAHIADIGWQEPVADGNVAGTINEGKSVQAFTISLSGEDSYSYDIYYQAYVENYGWLGWAKNGEWAGTTGGGLRCEAMHVLLLPRGSEAPGSTADAYIDTTPQPVDEGWYWPLDGIFNISSGFGYRAGGFHYGIDALAPAGTPIKAAKSGTVTIANWHYGYGKCVVIVNDNTGEDVYYAHMSAINTNVGAHVNQGDIIGFVGMTGSATANHLHLEIRDHGTYINALDLY